MRSSVTNTQDATARIADVEVMVCPERSMVSPEPTHDNKAAHPTQEQEDLGETPGKQDNAGKGPQEMTLPYRKKLIEVGLTARGLYQSAEWAREKSIRHGHPSTLQWVTAESKRRPHRAIVIGGISEVGGAVLPSLAG